MLANDMKKGQKGILKNSDWLFEIADNKKGIVRMAKVWGYATEIGSIYIDDIEHLWRSEYPGTEGVTMVREPIEFTPAQQKQIDTKNSSMASFGW